MTNQDSKDDLRRGQLEAIFNHAVDAIITIDTVGIIQDANPASETLFGYSPEELIGNNVKLLMPSPYEEDHDEYLAYYIRTGERRIIGIGREVTGKRKDGSTFPVHLAVSEFHVEGRRMFTGIVRDISDLKAAEQRLESMNEELEERVNQRTVELRAAQSELVKKEKLATLGQVSGGIAHEIRNPLNAVKTSAFYLLTAKNPSREKVTEHLERIDRQVDLIDSVVTALSDVAKLPEPQLYPHSIVDCLNQVLESTTLPNNITVSVQAAESLPNVMVDGKQIPIVFRNLVRNARDAMADGGELSIAVSHQGENIVVDVADTGEGIKSEHLERITEPLYSTKARGMGLGLAISLAILEKNQGRLEITSEPGVGSNFRVELQAETRKK